MIFRRVLTEIFEGVEDFRGVLNFVENDERLLGKDAISRRHNEILQNTTDVLRRFEELRVFFVFVEVEVRDVLVIEPPELLQEPRFPDLTHPLQDQRLATRRVLPLDEIL